MEITDCLICHFFCLPQDCVGFFVCLPYNPVPLFFQFLPALLGLSLELLGFFSVCLDLRPLLLNCTAAGFQIGEQIFKGNILLAQPFPGVLNNKLGKPKLSGK